MLLRRRASVAPSIEKPNGKVDDIPCLRVPDREEEGDQEAGVDIGFT